MPARLLLAACAIALVALLAVSLHHHDACDAARADVFGVALGKLPRSREAPAIVTLRDQCRGTAALVAASAALQRQDEAAQAQRLAQEAVRREPESATAWNALAVAARDRDPVTAQRAAGRALRLAPLDPPPVPLLGARAAGP